MNYMLLIIFNGHKNFRGEVILTACQLQNEILYKKTRKTCFELWKFILLI